MIRACADSRIRQSCERRVHLMLVVQECHDRILLELQLVCLRLEAVFGRYQRAVQFVVGKLQVGDAIFVGRLHLLIAMILRRDDAVLEDHVHGRERDPAEEDQRQTGERRLQCRAEGEELHPAVASNVDLALRKCFMEPRPDALNERPRHASFSLVCVLCADPDVAHFTQLTMPNQAFAPEKRSRR